MAGDLLWACEFVIASLSSDDLQRDWTAGVHTRRTITAPAQQQVLLSLGVTPHLHARSGLVA